MIAQALPKTQELTDKLNHLVYANYKPSEFDIACLKKEAGKLKGKIPYPDYYDFLGRIACLENDKVNMLRHYKNALTHSFNNKLIIKKNYFISLIRCGLVLKASEQLKEITKNFPTCAETLSFLIEQNFYLCRFRDALELFNKPEDKLEFFDIINVIVSVFESVGLSDDEAQNLCKLAFSLLELKSLYYFGSKIEIIGECVLYTIYVDKSIEEIFEINWELADVLVNNVENTRSDVLIFEYSSVDVLDEKEKH